MKKISHYKIFVRSVILFFLGTFIFSYELKAQVFNPEDSCCVSAIKPLPLDSLDWDAEKEACIEIQKGIAVENAWKAWQDSIASLITELKKEQKCFENGYSEKLTVAHTTTEHHYTLYYYDLGGNLVQTVPPNGVLPIPSSHFTDGVWDGQEPGHQDVHKTRYRYNSVGQIVKQVTPDAGESSFHYDVAQRLRFSQDARQEPNHDFSYTKYDGLNRIIETGELQQTGFDPSTEVDNAAYPDANVNTEDYVKTTYDELEAADPMSIENGRGRVVKTERWNDESVAEIETYFNYDAHGNVKKLTHKIPALVEDEQVDIEYDYDLISGNVNEVRYEPGEIDQFYHRYTYDADNRLTNVFTSDDGRIFERDARYFYYLHGPLARMELGEDLVQGSDYIYTLQGWIKGVNATEGKEYDQGADGVGGVDSYIGSDAMSYGLAYFENDYTSIGNNVFPYLSTVKPNKSLFNGNISYMITNNGIGAQGLDYNYDALHRIKSFDTYAWDPQSENVNRTDDYNTSYNYDPNGNLQAIYRGSPDFQDWNIFYQYSDSNAPNRLTSISGTNSDTYTYDPIGNLTSSNDAANIGWDVFGKVRDINRSSGEQISYNYDAQGNRLVKKRIQSGQNISDIYVRDASGNIMAIYEHDAFPDEYSVRLKEIPIYGSSRIGLHRTDKLLISHNTFGGNTYNAEIEPIRSIRNKKLFECANHLGNTLTVVSDQKLGTDVHSDGTADNYAANIVSASDYYPFGLEMPGRELDSDLYRYGFNGKEKDSSFDDAGSNHYDYGFRIYNPTIGRFLSVDPLTASYPWYTPYQFAGNTPIQAIDVDGAEPFFVLDYIARRLAEGTAFLNNAKIDMHQGLTKSNPSINSLPHNFNKDVLHKAKFVEGAGNFAVVAPTTLHRKLIPLIPGSSILDAGFGQDANGQEVSIASAALWLAFDLGTMGEGKIVVEALDQAANYFLKSDAGKVILTGTANVVDEVLELSFKVPGETKGMGLGTAMFDDAVARFGDEIKGVKGLWTYDQNGVMSDNLKTFLDSWDYLGGSFKAEEAAFHTFTGKLAKKHGYTDVRIIYSEIEEVEVLFTKPGG